MLLAICALVALCAPLVILRFWRSKSRVIPGPIVLPFFGQAFPLLFLEDRDLLPLFKKWFDRYGSLVQVEVLGSVYILLSEPEFIEKYFKFGKTAASRPLFYAQRNETPKSRTNDTTGPALSSSVHITKGYWEYLFFRPWLNDGLLLSTGDKWRLRRKLLTPSFHFKILESFLGGIAKNSEIYVKSILGSRGKPIDIQEPIRMATLKIICETAMGVTLSTDNEEQNAFIKAVKAASEGIVLRYLRFWLYPDFIYRRSKSGKRFYKSVDTLQSFSKKVIRRRKQLYQSEKSHVIKGNQNRRKAFLDLLLEVEDSNPGIFTEADIQEEVDTFMFEGHDTVSAAIIFSHFTLANHPDVQEKAFKEQVAIFGNDRRAPTVQDLQRMTYLEMVIKETLRLYPSVPFHSRKLYQDLKIDDNIVIPAGKSIAIMTYFIHRSLRHWEDPELFLPERFDPEINRHPFSYIPFSAGPRNCIGQKLAMMEMKTVLSTVLRNCILEPVTTSVDPVATIIIRNAGPVVVKVLPRLDPL